MLKLAILQARPKVHTLTFELLVVYQGMRVRSVTLKAVCGPSDDASPCITIMLPEED